MKIVDVTVWKRQHAEIANELIKSHWEKNAVADSLLSIGKLSIIVDYSKKIHCFFFWTETIDIQFWNTSR